MVMGNTGTVNITPDMMRNAMSAVDDYRNRAESLHAELGGTVDTLLSSSFSGNAADGFRFFYTEMIEAAVGEGLTNLLNALDEIFQGTLDAIPGDNGLDDQLGDGNRQS